MARHQCTRVPLLADADLLAALTLLGLALTGATAYALRVVLFGEIRSERVARAGTSAFLGRTPMEAAYATFEPLGRAFARLGVTANVMTATGVALSLCAGIAAASGALGLAAMIAAIAAAGDALDGIIARATTGPTPDGALYDSTADRYMEFFLLAGILVHVRASVLALALALGALSGSYMVSYVSAKSDGASIVIPRGSMRRAERAVYVILGCTLAPLAGALFPNTPWAYDAPVLAACALIAVVANASAVRRLLALGRALNAGRAAQIHLTATDDTPRELPAVAERLSADSRPWLQ